MSRFKKRNGGTFTGNDSVTGVIEGALERTRSFVKSYNLNGDHPIFLISGAGIGDGLTVIEQSEEDLSSMRYVDKIIVSEATSSVTFGEGGDGILGTALDGDSDNIYVCKFTVIPLASSGQDMRIRLNGMNATDIGGTAASNQQAATATAGFGGIADSDLVICAVGTIRDAWQGKFEFYAKTGQTIRGFDCWYRTTNVPTSTTNIVNVLSQGTWTEDTTNITSLGIESTNTSNVAQDWIGSGSLFVLYKILDS